MRAILVSDVKENIKRVYTQESLNWLTEHAGLAGDVYTKAMIQEQPEQWSQAEYIFSTWGMPVFTENEIQSYFPNLKAVFYAAGSVQAFARPFLNCKVKVFSAWAANAVPVAEYVTAQMILANKGFFRCREIGSRKGYEKAREIHSAYPGNYGVNIGIIGAGMIGKLIIRMLKNYEFRILVFDPFLSDKLAQELGVEKTTLDRIFSECQVVSNHLANNEQTKNMLNYPLFASMQPNAVFLNTGRGTQVVEADLIKVLQERPDLTAILDVTDPEPPMENSLFYRLNNCILTPHIAGSSGNELHRMAFYILEEFQRYKEKQPCLYEVDLKMLETMA